MSNSTKAHVLIGLANPYSVCTECKDKVLYWHDPDRCGCDEEAYNNPCKHKFDVISTCPTWGPIEGCTCDVSCAR